MSAQPNAGRCLSVWFRSSAKDETEKTTGCWDIPSKPQFAEPFLQPIIHLLIVACTPLVLEMYSQLAEPTVLRAEISWLW